MPIELKGVQLPALLALPDAGDQQTLIEDIHALLTKHAGFFDGEALALDLSALGGQAELFDWPVIFDVFRGFGLSLIGVCNAPSSVAQAFRDAGLASWNLSAREIAKQRPARKSEPEVAPKLEAAPAATQPAPGPLHQPTRLVDKPVRSGQRIYAEGGDLVVVAAVNPGGELIADGSIHVYGPLRGKALAGARGDGSARIYCTDFDAELVSVAGVYRVFEPGGAGPLAGGAVQVRLQSGSRGEQVVIEPLGSLQKA